MFPIQFANVSDYVTIDQRSFIFRESNYADVDEAENFRINVAASKHMKLANY